MAQLEVQHHVAGSAATLHVRGEIDVSTAPQLQATLDDLLEAGASRIVLACQDLSFLDSSGIALLVATRKRLGPGGELVIEAPQPHVRKVLELTGVTDELELLP